MNKDKVNRCFFLIKEGKILFKAIDYKNENILNCEISIEENSIDNIYHLLEKFLEKNLFSIEKKLKYFVNEIYLIFDNNNFFNAEASIRQNFQKNSQYNPLNETLIEIKNQFKKYSPDNEIIHMKIKKYIIDGNSYENLPKELKYDNFIIEVEFICLENKIIKKLKDIFAKYQIVITKMFSFKYLTDLSDNRLDIFEVAQNSMNGLNANEVILIKKKPEIKGFFEKFFNFFN